MSSVESSTPLVLHRGSLFWRIQVQGNVVVTFRGLGDGKTEGRRYSKQFATPALASGWASDAVLARKSEGYAEEGCTTVIDIKSSRSTELVPARDVSSLKEIKKQTESKELQAKGDELNSDVVNQPRRSVRKRPLTSVYFWDAGAKTTAGGVVDKQLTNRPDVNSRTVPSSQRLPQRQWQLPSMPKAKAKNIVSDNIEPPLKRVKRGMGGTRIVDTSKSLGVVDPGSGLGGEILTEWCGYGSSRQRRAIVYDVMLVLVDVKRNHDKFIVLQLVDDHSNSKYFLYERWGRTGMMGQSLILEYARNSKNVAVQKFESIFLQKTGVEWARARAAISPGVAGKYRMVKQNYDRKMEVSEDIEKFVWQYNADDMTEEEQGGIGMKREDDWYDYDSKGNLTVEQLYHEFQTNRTWLGQRVVRSGTYPYLVDLVAMTQTNVELPNRKKRAIRRIARKVVQKDINGIGHGNDVGDIEMASSFLNDSSSQGDSGGVKELSETIAASKSEPIEQKQEQRRSLVNGRMSLVNCLKLTAKKPMVVLPEPSGITKPGHKVKAVPQATMPKTWAKLMASKVTVKNEAKGVMAAAAAAVMESELLPNPDPDDVKIEVDSHCPDAGRYSVVGRRDAMLNQADITGKKNNNKYYRLQLLERKAEDGDVRGLTMFYVWTRWGRVGEVRRAQMKRMGPFRGIELAEGVFNRKFREKAGLPWQDRAISEPIQGKYEMLRMDYSVKPEMSLLNEDGKGDSKTVAESKLNDATKELIELLFEENLYLDVMKELDIDVRKMPLGKLTTKQIDKVVSILNEIEKLITDARGEMGRIDNAELKRLSSRFYTALPHDFGRRRPPPIDSAERLQKEFDVCNVLRHVEKAKNLMHAAFVNEHGEISRKTRATVDIQYDLLNADLRLLSSDVDSKELATLRRAFEDTKGEFQFYFGGGGEGQQGVQLQNVWRVERRGEAEKFRKLKRDADLDNHYLLWHGSHIGCVSAILATGLRIMAHSGGRCGRGIYLTAENSKCLHYTRPAASRKVGCVFIVEAMLGSVCETMENCAHLTEPPKGFDSVKACGKRTTPDVEMVVMDDVDVKIPTGKAEPKRETEKSAFAQDEFVVYKEEQVRIRYVMSVKF